MTKEANTTSMLAPAKKLTFLLSPLGGGRGRTPKTRTFPATRSVQLTSLLAPAGKLTPLFSQSGGGRGRTFLRKPSSGLLLLLTLIFANPAALNAQPNKKPNILFIAVDDLNTDLSCYGNTQVITPNFDRLARMGVVFNRAYNQYPLCSPSRTSILTGLNPDVTRIYELKTHFRSVVPDIITLPQLFKNNGYKTVRIGKIFHYGVPNDIGTNGLDDSISWHQRINPKGRDVIDQDQVINLVPGRHIGASPSYLIADGKDEEQTDGIIAAEAARFLKQQKQNDPFFLAVGFFRPHTPYAAPKKYFDMYPIDQIRLAAEPANDLDDIPPAAFFTNPVHFGMTQQKQKEAIRGYYASISFMDAQLGKVLDALEANKFAANTIIVLWSDHGYNLGQHGQWMKQSLFESSARGPLLMSVPGGARGQKVNGVVGLIDIYPTLAELSGIKLPQKVSGISLKPLLDNPHKKWEGSAFSQVKRGNIMGYSIRTPRWRYTEWDGGRAGTELYDELTDEGEITNLAADPEYADLVSALSDQLKSNFDSDARLRDLYLTGKAKQ